MPKPRKRARTFITDPEDHILDAGGSPHVTDPQQMSQSQEDLRTALSRFSRTDASVDPDQAGQLVAKFFFWAKLWPDFAPLLESAYEMYILRESLRLAGHCQAFHELFRRLPAVPALYRSSDLQAGPPFSSSETEVMKAYVQLTRLGHRIQVSYKLHQSALAKIKMAKTEESRKLAEGQEAYARKQLDTSVKKFTEVWKSCPKAAMEYSARRWFSRTVQRVLDVTGLKEYRNGPGANQARRRPIDAVIAAQDFLPDATESMMAEGRRLLQELKRASEEILLPGTDDLAGLDEILEDEV